MLLSGRSPSPRRATLAAAGSLAVLDGTWAGMQATPSRDRPASWAVTRLPLKVLRTTVIGNSARMYWILRLKRSPHLALSWLFQFKVIFPQFFPSFSIYFLHPVGPIFLLS